nr:truncated ORF7b [Severe acute respiratory syndrome coronavirus 2]QRN57576.1 truncated ORF7b [Severe acute respiratory syndrome coronavirus 2]QTO31671.1 truncated ORF7b [Severe acute respiratory syndrome coronavirus 2]QTX01236.1 truncated ORF7b [Severe acute respiratory syndrome coronavirus 2]QTY18886.1 truncated ORF7b [Severe acute respiratory syndrome coronavirus 2]
MIELSLIDFYLCF